MEGLLAEIIRMAGSLGLGWWERIAIILALAILIVLVKTGLKAIGKVKVEPLPSRPPSDGSSPEDANLPQTSLKPHPDGGFIVPTDPDHPGGEQGNGG